MGAAIQNMLLMATACGLSSTWIARPARIPAIRTLLDVPETLRTIAFVALGVARARADAPGAWDEHMRTPIRDKLHADRFGHQ